MPPVLRRSPSRSGIRTRTLSLSILIGNLSLPGEMAPGDVSRDGLTMGTVAGIRPDQIGHLETTAEILAMTSSDKRSITSNAWKFSVT